MPNSPAKPILTLDPHGAIGVFKLDEPREAQEDIQGIYTLKEIITSKGEKPKEITLTEGELRSLHAWIGKTIIKG